MIHISVSTVKHDAELRKELFDFSSGIILFDEEQSFACFMNDALGRKRTGHDADFHSRRINFL
jgi:hypothetical protein